MEQALDPPPRDGDRETALTRNLAAKPNERETAPEDILARFAEGTPGPDA